MFNYKTTTMKKVLAVLALALFIGGLTVPAVAAVHNDLAVITLSDDEQPKKETTEKTSETTEKTSETKAKSGDCTSHEKAEAPKTAEKKSSDCAAPAEKSQTAKK
jgi:hypothetical protein